MASDSWPEDFLTDLECLSATELRRKYRREESNHRNMKTRCGGGEDTYDPSWADFRQFLRDMGPRPEGTSLDRIDTNLRRYGPGLCRWATPKEQTENRPNTLWVLYAGDSMTLADYCARTGVKYATAYAGHRRGASLDVLAGKGGPRSHWEHPNPAVAAQFAARFQAWRKQVQPAYRELALPEVLYVAEVSEHQLEADAELQRLGFHELPPDTPDDHPIFRSRAYRVWLAAMERRREAMSYIARAHPHLVEMLTVSGDRTLLSIAQLPERATKRATP